MNKRRLRLILLLFLFLMHLTVNKFMAELNINIDFMYLILIYFLLRKKFFQTIIAAMIIGWATDYFAGTTVGIFGFSRVTIAFILYGIFDYIDPKRLISAMLIIFISLSFSNLIANLFMIFIYNFNFNFDLLIVQPFLTSLTGILILTSKNIRKALNVH